MAEGTARAKAARRDRTLCICEKDRLIALEQRTDGGEQMRVRTGPGPGDAGYHRPWQGGWSAGPVRGGWVRKERVSWCCEARARWLKVQR